MPDGLKGKIVLIDFWATSCGPCVASLPAVQEVWKQFGSRGVVIVGLLQGRRTKLTTTLQTPAMLPLPLRTNADGVILVGNTRVTLDTVVTAYKLGATADGIVLDYDSLSLADIYAVISYYLLHRHEVEAYLAEGEKQAEQVRRENEARRPAGDLRERLLARKAQREQMK